MSCNFLLLIPSILTGAFYALEPLLFSKPELDITFNKNYRFYHEAPYPPSPDCETIAYDYYKTVAEDLLKCLPPVLLLPVAFVILSFFFRHNRPTVYACAVAATGLNLFVVFYNRAVFHGTLKNIPLTYDRFGCDSGRYLYVRNADRLTLYVWVVFLSAAFGAACAFSSLFLKPEIENESGRKYERVQKV